MFVEHVKFMVESLGVTGEDSEIVSLQAADGLKTIFDDKDLIPQLSPFIGDLLQKFMSFTSHVNVKEFFEMLQDIVKYGLSCMRSS